MLYCAVFKTLKQKRLDINEVKDTIYDNINQQRADLQVCIPELGRVIHGVLAEHCEEVRNLLFKLGDNTLVRELVQESDQLIDEVNEALRLSFISLRDMECDWSGYEEDDATNQSSEHIITSWPQSTLEASSLQHIWWQRLPPISLQLKL